MASRCLGLSPSRLASGARNRLKAVFFGRSTLGRPIHAVTNHNPSTRNPHKTWPYPRGRSRAQQRKTENREAGEGENGAANPSTALEAMPGNRANTGVPGKKNPNRKRLGFYDLVESGGIEPPSASLPQAVLHV